MDEKNIISLLKQGDPAAMKAMFDTWHQPLCTMAFRVLRDKDDAKDAVQNVFIKIWQSRHTIEITGTLAAYLRRATINTALNAIERKDAKHTDLSIAEIKTMTGNPTDAQVNLSELEEAATNAVCHLPPRTRLVFSLIRAEEMSYKEVADALDISTKAVEKEMMRALKLLRTALKPWLGASLVWMLAHAL